MRKALAAAIAVGLLVCTTTAQQPVFRSRVELVTVDVTVVNGDGDPLTDLPADSFQITVDGSARRVVWAEFVPRTSAPLAATYKSNWDENRDEKNR